jgi:3-dehydroquinate dehydratase/shikimate dehydrogenase
MVELRLDTVHDPDAAGALLGRRIPAIVTCRPTWEGGCFTGSEEERKRLLSDALACGAEYIDVESSAGFGDLVIQTGGRRVVLSFHDFTGIPLDLDARLRAMRSTGAQVVKLAVKTRRLDDAIRLRALGTGGDDLVVIGMGEPGLVTRVLPSRFHSAWTYAGDLAGVGQLTSDAMLREFRVRDIGPETALYGLVGSPVAHSVSPAMHNAAFRQIGLDAVYLPLAATDVEDFVTFARAFALQGASVTIPFKVSLAGRVDEVSADARRIGAINTIRTSNGRWIGDNSDLTGFLDPLSGHRLEGARAAILGAGGAARSVAVALGSSGARVSIHARNRERAAHVAALVHGSVGQWPPPLGSWDLLVNCTPVGMYPHVHETPLPAESLGGGTVYDLVYNPQRTRLLCDAERAGCPTIGGLDMLVAQARQQVSSWTGVRPPVGVMQEAALRKLADFGGAL